jgi:hypothetical protein
MQLIVQLNKGVNQMTQEYKRKMVALVEITPLDPVPDLRAASRRSSRLLSPSSSN